MLRKIIPYLSIIWVSLIALTACNGEQTIVNPSSSFPESSEEINLFPESDGDIKLAPESNGDINLVPESREEIIFSLDGKFEFAQVQVVEENSKYEVPKFIPGRDALILFTPDQELASNEALALDLIDNTGNIIDTVKGIPPDDLANVQENLLGAKEHIRYSTKAWSFKIYSTKSWNNNRYLSKIVIKKRNPTSNVVQAKIIDNINIGAPTNFVVGRAPIVMWDENESYQPDLYPSQKLAENFFSSVPVASMIFADYKTQYLNYIIAKSKSGVQRFNRDEFYNSRIEYYSILKWTTTIPISLANTGRGLIQSNDGDASPYAYNTLVGLGWYKKPDGSYGDMDDYNAGGWTGWSAIWNSSNSQCGNTFFHETGHAFTLGHFTNPIYPNYPNAGVIEDDMPWGFDSVKWLFRTTYRIDENGNKSTPKHDPMNGGENSNAISCFQQYTPLHAKKIQDYLENGTTIREEMNSFAKWNSITKQFELANKIGNYSDILKAGVPVITIVGTLAQNGSASQIYPAFYSNYGNVFAEPSPTQANLDKSFNDSVYFIKINYKDNSVEYRLIRQSNIYDRNLLRIFSTNLDRSKHPMAVSLYKSQIGYPNIDITNAKLLFTRNIDNNVVDVPRVIRLPQDIGNDHHMVDFVPNEEITLSRSKQIYIGKDYGQTSPIFSTTAFVVEPNYSNNLVIGPTKMEWSSNRGITKLQLYCANLKDSINIDAWRVGDYGQGIMQTGIHRGGSKSILHLQLVSESIPCDASFVIKAQGWHDRSKIAYLKINVKQTTPSLTKSSLGNSKTSQ